MKKHSEKDMYLPAWLLGLAVIFFAAAVLCVIFIHDRLLMIPCAVICALVGIAAALCWNNQWIEGDRMRKDLYVRPCHRQEKDLSLRRYG